MRHGPELISTCEACGADGVRVQLYTDDILKDPIMLCVDANAKECMDRQQAGESSDYDIERGIPGRNE